VSSKLCLLQMEADKKKILKLILISVAFITVGVVVGLGLNYKTLKELRSAEREATLPVVEEESEEKIATHSGTIKPAGKLFKAADHYLEDENGNIKALLKGGKIDLNFVEGQSVEVEGEVGYVVEGDQQFLILEVLKVRF